MILLKITHWCIFFKITLYQIHKVKLLVIAKFSTLLWKEKNNLKNCHYKLPCIAPSSGILAILRLRKNTNCIVFLHVSLLRVCLHFYVSKDYAMLLLLKSQNSKRLVFFLKRSMARIPEKGAMHGTSAKEYRKFLYQ